MSANPELQQVIQLAVDSVVTAIAETSTDCGVIAKGAGVLIH
jgi:hypothetical protein